MKKLIILLSLVLLTACGVKGNSQQDMDKLVHELNGMEVRIANLQSTNDELALRNEALSIEVAHKSDAVVELETEVAYLSNEVVALRSGSSVGTQTTTASVKPSTGREGSGPKIVIVDDTAVVGQSLYSHAYELYNQGRYQESLAKFNEFINKMPNDKLANNAQYWIGENYYSMSNYPKALEAFQLVITKYPRGLKVPDATLKVGFSQSKLGRAADAKATLNSLVSNYPNSRAATIARDTLTTM